MKKGEGKTTKKAMKFVECKSKTEKCLAAYDDKLHDGNIIKRHTEKNRSRPYESCWGITAIRRAFDKRAA